MNELAKSDNHKNFKYEQKHNRVLALAGSFQAVAIVHTLAVDNKMSNESAEVCVGSLFNFNPKNTIDIYGGKLVNVQLGIKTLLAQLNGKSSTIVGNVLVNKYMVACLVLAKKLLNDKTKLNALAEGLNSAKIIVDNSGLLHRATLAKLAELYQNTISLIPPKIIVRGRDGNLTNIDNINRIRTLLMCGVRSSILWYQLGGSRLSFMFRSKSYLATAEEIYNELKNS